MYYFCRDGANAIPGYQKFHARVIRIRNNRGGQLNRSAMAKPHSGGTAFVITVTPTPESKTNESCTEMLIMPKTAVLRITVANSGKDSRNSNMNKRKVWDLYEEMLFLKDFRKSNMNKRSIRKVKTRIPQKIKKEIVQGETQDKSSFVTGVNPEKSGNDVYNVEDLHDDSHDCEANPSTMLEGLRVAQVDNRSQTDMNIVETVEKSPKSI